MAVVPPLKALTSSYPTMPKQDLAIEMGFEGKALQTTIDLWENTCAIRMSYCLLKCGVALGKEPGRGDETMIRAGKLKGRHFWMNRAKLSAHLRNAVFGKPTFEGSASSAEGYEKLVDLIGKSGGVISFDALAGDLLSNAYGGGHLDVVYYDDNLIGEDYDLMIESVDWLQTRGFKSQCNRATSLKFWKASAVAPAPTRKQ